MDNKFIQKRAEMKKAEVEKSRGLALRVATGAARTTPTATVRVLLDVRPLKNSFGLQAANSQYWINHKHLRIVKERSRESS